MRIVSGFLKGRVLEVPRGTATRPTSARARAALFDILAPILDGAKVADMFAGTGAIGIEALSRGAAHVDFYESARPALRALTANLSAMALQAMAHVISNPLPASLNTGPQYDLVVMDPPWRKGLELGVARRLVACDRVGPSTHVVVEADRRDAVDEAGWASIGLAMIDTRRYGDTEMRFFARSARVGA